jgi:bacterial leucyl aminopeptidase
MRFNQWMSCIAMSSIFASMNVLAANAPVHEQLQVPQCLVAKIVTPYEILAENQQFKIIDISSADIDALSLLADEVHCGRFVNVSHHLKRTSLTTKHQLAQKILEHKPVRAVQERAAVYEIKHQEAVNAALKNVVDDNIWQTLSHLTAFYNRSANQDTGVQTAKWLKSTFDAMVQESGRTDTASFFVATDGYIQDSLVTVIGKDLPGAAIVIGAHMDTLGGRMPGAGDDGSGSSSNMEMARVLLSSHMTFKRPIYIIWYAAEERGLVGSQSVVDYFVKNAIAVKAAIQFDMTGYRVDPKDPTMWVYTDPEHTNRNLSNFVAKLIDTYIKVPVDYSKCGYGCSDHASWQQIGVPAAFPCESNFKEHNPYIHSASDTMELLSLEHMSNFSKLAIAFAIELASD